MVNVAQLKAGSHGTGRVHGLWTRVRFLPAFTGHEHGPCGKKHCRTMLFLNTAREHRSCEQRTRVHGPCRRYV